MHQRIDLHTHSTASDGTLTPTELMRAAKAAGLSAIALTDHDTFEGLPEARAEAERQGLFQPGFRSASAQREHGTGHGLAFVHQVVELHGGLVGYEPAELGNNVYVVLPLEEG